MMARIGNYLTYMLVAALLVMWFCQAFPNAVAWAAGIVLSAPVEPGGPFGVADSNNIKGGPLHLSYSSELRTVPEYLKSRGTLAYVRETGAYYQAYSTNGHYWRRWGGDAADVSGKLDAARYLDYSSRGRFEQSRFTMFSTHWGKPDSGKLDVQRFLNYSALGRGGGSVDISGKLDVQRFLDYSALGRGTGSVDISGKLDIPRFVNFSTHWGKTDESRLAVQRFLNYSSKGRGGVGPRGERGYDGRHAQTLTCTILNGTRTLIYNAAGEIQTSSLEPLYAYMYVDNQLTTPVSYEWYIPATGTQLKYPPIQPDGMQIRYQYFAFRAYSTYSAARNNNYARVTMQYSSVRQPYGRRSCTAVANIDALIEGPQGIQGIPGPSATVTLPAVEDAFSSTASNNPLILQTTSGTQSKLEVWDTGSNTRMWFDTEGNQYVMDANGNTLVKILSDGSIWLFRPGNIARARFLNNGTITTYHSDGTTPAYQIYSTGWTKGRAGWPASNGVCKKYNTDGSEYFEACATGGAGNPGGTDKQFQYNNNGAFGGSTHLKETATGVEITGTLVVK